MKKKIFALAMVAILSLMFFTSCGKKEPEFFEKGYAYVTPDYYFTEVKQPKGVEPSEALQEKIENIFETLCTQYNIQKELPKIEVITKKQAKKFWGNTDEVGDLGQYNDGVLYLLENCHEGVIAHELCHYLSDNGEVEGMHYQAEDIIIGRYFNEGITNYFSTKLFPHDEYYSIYEYETHVAKLLAIIYGEENLQNAYFSGNPEGLRNDINACIQEYYEVYHLNGVPMYAFEAMATSIDTYTMAYLYAVQGPAVDEFYYEDIALSNAEAQSVEEMLLFYAREKGVEKEVKKEIKSFMDSNILGFNFQELF